MKGKFWFSQKQKYIRMSNGDPLVFALINGEVKEYTEMIGKDSPNYENYHPTWDDAIYLGEGEFHSAKPILLLNFLK